MSDEGLQDPPRLRDAPDAPPALAELARDLEPPPPLPPAVRARVARRIRPRPPRWIAPGVLAAAAVIGGIVVWRFAGGAAPPEPLDPDVAAVVDAMDAPAAPEPGPPAVPRPPRAVGDGPAGEVPAAPTDRVADAPRAPRPRAPVAPARATEGPSGPATRSGSPGSTPRAPAVGAPPTSAEGEVEGADAPAPTPVEPPPEPASADPRSPRAGRRQWWGGGVGPGGRVGPGAPQRVQASSIRSVVARRRGELTSCYARHGGQARVRLALRIRVRPDGRVQDPTATGPAGTDALCRCIERAAAGWRFPASHEGTSVSIPLAFDPATDRAP